MKVPTAMADATRSPATATERALDNRVVRQGIVEATAPHLLPTLARVNRAFYEDTHQPHVWTRQYAPARVDWASRTIFCALPAQMTGPHAFAYEPEGREPKALRGPLGRCAGDDWHLSLGHWEDLVFSARTAQILDEVNRIYPLGAGRWSPETETAENTGAQVPRGDRLRAYAFLRNRLYRLEHGLSVAVYSTEAHQDAVNIVLAVFTSVCLLHSAMGANKANGAQPSATVDRVLSAVAIATMLGLCFACWYPYHGDNPARRNALFGPFDYFKLNEFAHEMARLERAEKTAAILGNNSVAS